MPLLLSRLYVPMRKDIAQEREEHLKLLLYPLGPGAEREAKEEREVPMLVQAWNRHFPFLLANYKMEVAEEVAEEFPLRLDDPDPLNPFGDLMRLLQPLDEAVG